MKELLKELTDREREILILREKKVPYKTIGEQYGISQNRVRQISVEATRKLRDAQRRLLASEANQMIVLTLLTRSDLILISEALHTLQQSRMSTVTYTIRNMRSIMEDDPIYTKAKQVLEKIDAQLIKTSGKISETVAEKLPDALANTFSQIVLEQKNRH